MAPHAQVLHELDSARQASLTRPPCRQIQAHPWRASPVPRPSLEAVPTWVWEAWRAVRGRGAPFSWKAVLWFWAPANNAAKEEGCRAES